MANLVEKFPWFHCVIHEKVCRELLEGSACYDHKQSCLFRKVNCPYLECTKMTDMVDVGNHVYKGHSNEKTQEVKFDETIKAGFIFGIHNYFAPHQVKTPDAMQFYFVGFRQNSTKLSFIWIYAIGSPEEAKNYKCSISLARSGKTSTYEGSVHTLDEHYEDIVEKRNAFVIDDHELKQFRTSTQMRTFEVEFQFSIRRLTEYVELSDSENAFFNEKFAFMKLN